MGISRFLCAFCALRDLSLNSFRRAASLFVGLAIAPIIAAAFPGALDGHGLRADLEATRRVHSGNVRPGDLAKSKFVLGYIGGVVDSLNNDTSGHFFCQPPSVTVEQDAVIILRYIAANELLVQISIDDSATLIIFDALGAAYPCPKQRRSGS